MALAEEFASAAGCGGAGESSGLLLAAGDFCLYRNSLWHLGNYVPYAQRATLHDAVDTDEFESWRAEVCTESQHRVEAGHGMENPNGP